MDLRTSTYLRLRAFPSGRAIFALSAVRAAASARGDQAMLEAVDSALTVARRARELERAWALQRRTDQDGTGASPIMVADRHLDSELGALDQVLDASERRYKRRDPAKSQRIAAVRAKLAPRGFAVIIRAVHEEELVAVAELVALATDGADADVTAIVNELQLADDIAAINGARDALAATIAQQPPERVRFKAVTATRAELREALCDVLVRALAATQGDDAGRAALVGPIAQQDEDMRLYTRRRQGIPDVDPSTGEIDDAIDPLLGDTD